MFNVMEGSFVALNLGEQIVNVRVDLIAMVFDDGTVVLEICAPHHHNSSGGNYGDGSFTLKTTHTREAILKAMGLGDPNG